MKLQTLLYTLSVLSLSAPAFAVSDGEDAADTTPLFGSLSYGGTGCPDGTLSLADEQAADGLALRFSAFAAEAGGEKSLDRKACNIAIPVKVPAGYRLSVMAVDASGHADLTAGARANLRVENFFTGQGRGVVWKQTLYGPLHDVFEATDHTSEDELAWTECGADTILRSSLSLIVKANAEKEQAAASIDSGFLYRVLMEKCE